MRYAFAVLFIISSMAFAQTAEKIDTKFSVPTDEELIPSRAMFSEVYGEQIKAAKTIDEKLELADEITKLAQDSDDRYEKYLLIEQAKELAVDAKNLNLTLQTIDLLAETFKVDKEQLRKEAKLDIANGSAQTAKILQRLEELDKKAKADPTELVTVADTCYELSKTLRGPIQQTAIERAIGYYEDATPNLKGLVKLKVNARLKELRNPTLLTRKTSPPHRRNDNTANLECLPGDWKAIGVGRKWTDNWTFREDGTVYSTNYKRNGQWRSTPEGSVTVVWPDGCSNHLRSPLDPRGIAVDSSSTGILSFVLRKK